MPWPMGKPSASRGEIIAWWDNFWNAGPAAIGSPLPWGKRPPRVAPNARAGTSVNSFWIKPIDDLIAARTGPEVLGGDKRAWMMPSPIEKQGSISTRLRPLLKKYGPW